jgi:hypothetical protein
VGASMIVPSSKRERHLTSGFLGFLAAVVVLWALAALLCGCASRHAYNSTDQKTDPNAEWYSGSRYYSGRYHDLWCKRDSNGVTVCRFE